MTWTNPRTGEVKDLGPITDEMAEKMVNVMMSLAERGFVAPDGSLLDSPVEEYKIRFDPIL